MGKLTLCLLILIMAITSCKTNEKTLGNTEEQPVRIANEELEYEVIVFDIGFNRFLNTQAQPRGFYTPSFLEVKNKFFVSQYNSRVGNINKWGDFYGPRINYENHLHYGYEVNYLLYNYFLFFQQKYNQKL